MPAIISHQLFGEAVIGTLGDGFLPSNDMCDAFLLGNQGPDSLFFSLRTRNLMRVKRLGQAMHHRNIAAALEAFRNFSALMKAKDQAIARAYALGYICHYSLDSTTHPLIIAQQQEILDAGIEGLDENSVLQVHGQIESDLDSYILWQKKHLTIKRYRPHKEILHASTHVLDIIDKLYRFMAASAYGIVLPQGEYHRAIIDMRLSMRALYSPRGIKRAYIGHLERSVHKHSLAQAMSHRKEAANHCGWDNHEHRSLKHPFADETISASFDELFVKAQVTALEGMLAYLEDGDLQAICGTLDFNGRPL